MFYLIYDNYGEFYNILDLSPEELIAYNANNPLHTTELADEQEDLFFDEDEFETPDDLLDN